MYYIQRMSYLMEFNYMYNCTALYVKLLQKSDVEDEIIQARICQVYLRRRYQSRGQRRKQEDK